MQLTHFDENGKAIMVDVTEKNDTEMCIRDRSTPLMQRKYFVSFNILVGLMK